MKAAPAPTANAAFSFVSKALNGISADPDGSTRQKVDKSFPPFAEAVREKSVSRIHLGVHLRFDGIRRSAAENVGGVRRGLAIGSQAHAFLNTAASLGGTN